MIVFIPDHYFSFYYEPFLTIRNGLKCSFFIRKMTLWIKLNIHSYQNKNSLCATKSVPRKYLENIFDRYLCAFRKGHGCQTTLLRLLEDCETDYIIFDVFSLRSIFISPNEHQKQYFVKLCRKQLILNNIVSVRCEYKKRDLKSHF